jgi:tetratricopeptide (TPR) repeat protein
MPRFPSLPLLQGSRRRFAAALVRGVLVAGLLLAFSSGASAQSAKDLYDQGMAALNAGRYADAAQALDASYRAQPTAIVLYNLGLAYKGMGHPDKAQEAFESYVKFADPKKEGKTINAVKAEIERMKNGYARYALKLTPANAQILIDGAPATASNGELWVQTGSHKIAFKADGYED